MTPQLALWLILAISVLTTAAVAPLTWQFRQEMARAKAAVANYAAIGLASALLGTASIALWWWYALATDQILLGVIPTFGWAWGVVIRSVTNRAKAGA